MLMYNEHLPSAIYTLSLESFINYMYLPFFFFNFRIKITGIFDYPSHSEEQSADTTVITEGSLDPTLQQGDAPSKPILMVSVENVLHEPFKVTEEVKVQDTRNER